MKVIKLGLLLCASLTFFACDDTTHTLGMDMLPDSDAISTHTTTFDVTTRSVEADAVYAKTAIGYVGKFTDSEFGDYTASFLTESGMAMCSRNRTEDIRSTGQPRRSGRKKWMPNGGGCLGNRKLNRNRVFPGFKLPLGEHPVFLSSLTTQAPAEAHH